MVCSKQTHVVITMLKAVLHCGLACHLTECLLDSSPHLVRFWMLVLTQDGMILLLDGCKQALNGELVGIRHLRCTGHIILVLVKWNMPWFSLGNVPAVWQLAFVRVARALSVINLEPLVCHPMARVTVKREQEKWVGPAVHVPYRSTQVLIHFPAEPARVPVLFEVLLACIPDCWDGPQSQPLLKLNFNKAIGSYPFSSLHNIDLAYFYAGMGVPSKRRAEAGLHMEAVHVTKELKTICADRLHTSRRNPSLSYRCACGNSGCYRVLRLATVQKDDSPATFGCPAHNSLHPKYSPYVPLFYDLVKKIDPAAKIIWDWCCVPGRPKMSIDATIVHGQRCTAFEIDGGRHCDERECKRSCKDVIKDEILMKMGRGMMRLHHKDKDQWEQYIRYHMARPVSIVQCTQSYEDCVDVSHDQPIVLSIQDVEKSAQ